MTKARVSELLTNRPSLHRGVVLCASHEVCVCDCARHTVAISGYYVLLPYWRKVYMCTVSRVYIEGVRGCVVSLSVPERTVFGPYFQVLSR